MKNERVRTALLIAVAIEGAIGAWSAHELVEAVHEGFGMEVSVEQAEELAADVDEIMRARDAAEADMEGEVYVGE